MRVAVSTEAAACDHFPSSQEILFVRLVISLLFSFRISMHISRALISDLSTSNSIDVSILLKLFPTMP